MLGAALRFWSNLVFLGGDKNVNIFSSVFSRDLGPVPFFISGLMLALMKAAKSGQWEDVDQVDSLLSMEALQLEL